MPIADAARPPPFELRLQFALCREHAAGKHVSAAQRQQIVRGLHFNANSLDQVCLTQYEVALDMTAQTPTIYRAPRRRAFS